MNINRRSLGLLGILIVILHVLVVFVHAMAHTNLFIAMSFLQNLYIFLVILAGPIFAAAFLRRDPPIGFAVLTASMLGSFLFGAYYHFVAISSDNVFTMHSGQWEITFQVSAVLLAMIEFAGTGVGLLGFISEE
jgi:hypothetical protein